MWTIEVKRADKPSWMVDWEDGTLTSNPPNLAVTVAETLSREDMVGASPVGPYAPATMAVPYAVFTVAQTYLRGLGLKPEDLVLSGDYAWPETKLQGRCKDEEAVVPDAVTPSVLATGSINLVDGTLDVGGAPEGLQHLFGDELTAMGSITLNEDGVEEFFNHHHAKDGKFGSGGSSKGSDSTGSKVPDGPMKGHHPTKEEVAAYRKEKLKKIALGVGVAVLVTGLLIAGVHYDTTHIQGQKIAAGKGDEKGYYGVNSNHGTKIVLVDQAGLKPRQRKTLLKQTKAIHDKVPLPDGKGVNIIAKATHDLSPDAEAFTSPGTPNTIFVNASRFFHPAKRNGDLKKMGPDGKVFFTQDYYHGGVKSQERHLLFHEYGHLTDDGATNHESMVVKVRKAYTRAGANFTGPHSGLGVYATKDDHEAYAEAFADWHGTKGKTKSAATHDYAKTFGWK